MLTYPQKTKLLVNVDVTMTLIEIGLAKVSLFDIAYTYK